jgi:hypothetical protein
MNQEYKIADFVGKELPPDILEQLKIVGRVRHFLKPTSVSAVSQSENQPEVSTTPLLNTEREVQDNISGLIDEVKEFEDQVEQLEDLLDEHLKDMAIPAVNGLVSEAIKQLGGDEGLITKEILDKAISIMDYFPIMSLGQDPVLAALTGDGTLTGPYLQCNEITSSIGKEIKLIKRDAPSPENSIKDTSMTIADNHEKRMKSMMLDIILNLWWNVLWTKFVVDMVIINPLRQMYAFPYDSAICFFKKSPRFKINKLLNKARKLLLCEIPPKFYKNYKPFVEIDCKNIEPKCSKEGERAEISSKDLGVIYDEIGDNTPCFNGDEFVDKANTDQPTGFGCPPECVKAAKIVLDAIMSDALTPPEGNLDPIRKNILETGVLND